MLCVTIPPYWHTITKYKSLEEALYCTCSHSNSIQRCAYWELANDGNIARSQGVVFCSENVAGNSEVALVGIRLQCALLGSESIA